MKRQKSEAGRPENTVAEGRAEYDFSKGVRGHYAARYAEGTNLVALAPDVAAVFPDSKSVNEALRTLVRLGQHIPTAPGR
jgi:hypothetical protein